MATELIDSEYGPPNGEDVDLFAVAVILHVSMLLDWPFDIAVTTSLKYMSAIERMPGFWQKNSVEY